MQRTHCVFTSFLKIFFMVSRAAHLTRVRKRTVISWKFGLFFGEMCYFAVTNLQFDEYSYWFEHGSKNTGKNYQSKLRNVCNLWSSDKLFVLFVFSTYYLGKIGVQTRFYIKNVKKQQSGRILISLIIHENCSNARFIKKKQ